jgi:hypothetical protein
MFSSTVIPTIGRPTLDRAVRSVLDQGFSADDFEVIVVNDSGERLPLAGLADFPTGADDQHLQTRTQRGSQRRCGSG